MTMLGVFHRIAADPASNAPNAPQPGTPAAGQDADAAVTAQFSAALTSLLARATGTESDDPALSGTPTGDTAQQSLAAALANPAAVTSPSGLQPAAAAVPVDAKGVHRALDLVAPE